VPFRTAHRVVGSLVAKAEEARIGLDAVPYPMIRQALAAADDDMARSLADDPTIGDELRRAAAIDGALASCDVIGGTAPTRVAGALAATRARLGS
jgi:argininosuccinate lyase